MIDEWVDRAERVYFFQSSGLYAGKAQPSITCLLPSDTRLFMDRHANISQANITHWRARCGAVTQPCQPSVTRTVVDPVTAAL
ncbi:MAG TPA: hypothetical protein VGW57_15370 [Chthoniobacterales bacterium]|nr:hypothetical protein [Chthoniobacterales bacterium]